jgi:PEP-utilising enzyme, mobile domain
MLLYSFAQRHRRCGRFSSPALGRWSLTLVESCPTPAIIAREFRVPAVVATRVGTAQLHDGQVVTVDGTTGTVELLR